MKKIFFIVCSLIMVLMFQNCGGDFVATTTINSEQTPSTGDEDPPNEEENPAPPIVNPTFTEDTMPDPVPTPEPQIEVGDRVFYVDSSIGNNTNSGLSENSPFQSVAAINSLTLRPGDRIYFRRGQVFLGIKLYLDDSGSATKPIVFGSYGSGNLPVLDGNGMDDYGFQAIDVSHIQVKDLHIRNFQRQGVWLRRTSDWQFYNMIVENTGSEGSDGGFRCFDNPTAQDLFPACKNVRFHNVTVRDVYGDGIGIWHSEQIVVANSRVVRTNGSDSDNIHINYSRDIDIVGNDFSMAESQDSTKGNICICTTYPPQAFDYNRVKGNRLDSGNFGISVAGEEILIIKNDFLNHNNETWAAGVLTAESINTRNIYIEDNLFHSGSFAINIGNNYSETYDRIGYRIVGNEFIAPQRAAINIRSGMDASGVTDFNALYSPEGFNLFRNQSLFTETNNQISNTLPSNIEYLDLSSAGHLN